MKSWLLVAILLSVIVLAGAIAAVPAAAAKGSNQDEDMTREKADEKRAKNFAMVISSMMGIKSIIIGNIVQLKG